jgi:hypothetical protein
MCGAAMQAIVRIGPACLTTMSTTSFSENLFHCVDNSYISFLVMNLDPLPVNSELTGVLE